LEEKNEWILQQLEQLYHNADFYDKALIKATKDIIIEQDKRMFQMEGELDGTLWSPKNWYD